MKFAIFALIASVCLASSASANIFQNWNKDLMNLEKDIQGFKFFDWVESLFDDSYDFLKTLLKDADAVQCFIKDALTIDEIGQVAEKKIKTCATGLVMNGEHDYTEVMNGLKDINEISTMLKGFHATEILDFQYKKLFATATKLMQTVENVSKHAKQYEAAIKGDAKCLKNTVTKLVSTFESFPAQIKTCQKQL